MISTTTTTNLFSLSQKKNDLIHSIIHRKIFIP
jgi:hypothetical protein